MCVYITYIHNIYIIISPPVVQDFRGIHVIPWDSAENKVLMKVHRLGRTLRMDRVEDREKRKSEKHNVKAC